MPSGATSHSRAVSCATGRSLSSSSSTHDVAEQLDPLRQRSRGEGERAAVVGALVHRGVGLVAVRAPHAAVEPAEQVGGDLEPVLAARRARRAARPRRARACAPRSPARASRARPPSGRDARCGARPAPPGPASIRAVPARRRCPCPRPSATGPTSAGTPGGSRSPDPGSTSSGNACDHGPRSPFDGALQAGHEPQHGLGVAVRPAADGVHRALDRAEKSSHTEPCFQYSSRRWWRSHSYS